MFLINLLERTDRLSVAREQLECAGLSGVEHFPAMKFSDRAGFHNAATRGCFHSHLECLRRAEIKGNNALLIEDDLDICASFSDLRPLFLQVLGQREWDFVYFGHEGTGDIPRAPGKITPGQVLFRSWTGSILTTHFYGVNHRIIGPLIEHLEGLACGPEGDCRCGPMSVDGAYTIFRENNPQVRCLIVAPKLGWQRPSRSDISPRSFDQIKLLQPAIAMLRHVRRRLR